MHSRRGHEVTSQSPCYMPTTVHNTRVNCLLQSLIQWSLSFLSPSNNLVLIFFLPRLARCVKRCSTTCLGSWCTWVETKRVHVRCRKSSLNAQLFPQLNHAVILRRVTNGIGKSLWDLREGQGTFVTNDSTRCNLSSVLGLYLVAYGI